MAAEPQEDESKEPADENVRALESDVDSVSSVTSVSTGGELCEND